MRKLLLFFALTFALLPASPAQAADSCKFSARADYEPLIHRGSMAISGSIDCTPIVMSNLSVNVVLERAGNFFDEAHASNANQPTISTASVKQCSSLTPPIHLNCNGTWKLKASWHMVLPAGHTWQANPLCTVVNPRVSDCYAETTFTLS